MGEKRRPRGWWYPYIFIGAFMVVIAVNGALLYFATSTFSGLQTEDAYEKGVAYNRALAAMRAQEQLGWTAKVSVAPGEARPSGELPAELMVTFQDRDGRALDRLDVKGMLTRPTVSGYDAKVNLVHVGGGRYAATVELPLPGQWQLDLVAFWGDVSYQVSERLFIR